MEQQPITVEKLWIEDVKDKSQIPIKPDEEAVTQWKFGCKNDFDFQIVEKTQLADEYMVTVKITAIKCTLTAPITVYLPKAASEDTKKHEEAHVEICKRVYSHAKQVAQEAAMAMIDHNFQASGKTVEDAVRNAISIANSEVSDTYHLNTGEEVRRVSEILDSLDEHNHALPLAQLVEQAFGHYTRLSGEVRVPTPAPFKKVDDSRKSGGLQEGKRTRQSIEREKKGTKAAGDGKPDDEPAENPTKQSQ